VNTWSGVRALADDGRANPSAVTRDYTLVLDEPGPKLLSVFGGKLTTYRRLAEHALQKLGVAHPWTSREPLPGGDFASFDALTGAYERRYPWLARTTLRPLLRRHGNRAAAILDGVETEAALGECFGAGLYEREVRYLVEQEWARCVEDIIWRRTKAGLILSAAQVDRLGEGLNGMVRDLAREREVIEE